MSSTSSERPTSQRVCCGCNLLCDDVIGAAHAERPEPLSGYCERGIAWLQTYLLSEAVAYVDGQPQALTTALEEARRRINHARHLQIVGLDRLDQRAVHAAAQLALSHRGSLDINFQPVSSFEFALQKVGRVTATLGELRQRSDLVVLWFCDPAASHPRFLERISADDKRVVAVGEHCPVGDGGTDSKQNERFRFSKAEAEQCLEWLRFAVDSRSTAMFAAIPTKFLGFIRLILDANDVSWIVDPNEFEEPFSAMSLHEAVRCLNDRRRAVLFSLRRDCYGLGAENVLLSVFGLARAINLNTGRPRFHWNEFSAIEQLRRGDTDVVLWICDAEPQEVATWQSRFPEIAWIIWNTKHETPAPSRGVYIPISAAGLSESCDLTRLDDLMLPVVGERKTSAPTPLTLLKSLNASTQ